MPNACRVEHNSSTISAATEPSENFVKKACIGFRQFVTRPLSSYAALGSNTPRGARNPVKKLLLTLSPALVFASTLLAIPLTALIFQESAKLADKVTAWNNQCGDKPWYDEVCLKKRSELSGQLGQFVALVNNELNSLRNISPDASPDFVREATGRRKIMELEVRNALHVIRCLGVLASDSECKAESAAIETEKVVLETEYKQTHAVFDGNWISLRATVSPAPKKP